ncbi:hypothetical protein DFS34DRAFT_639844 [Phlyctochytrium arcticum]|nr:hypothetical protein DFS34DRAFT_639844 [Phlyctochytrium arcticum]
MGSYLAAKYRFLVLSLILPIFLGSALSNISSVESACTCHSDAPRSLTGYIDRETTSSSNNLHFSRVSCNYDVALYMSDALKALPSQTTQWIVPFYNKVWKYLKKTYGGCTVDRQIPASAGGPGCRDFGAPKPLVVQLGVPGAGWYNGWYKSYDRFDPSFGNERVNFRSYLTATFDGWSDTNFAIKQKTIYALCILVEYASQGVHHTPMVNYVWGQDNFSEMCMYDVFRNTGFAAEAAQEYDILMAKTQSKHPSDATNVNWFKDWFWPLYQENNHTMSFQSTYFGLMSQYFPTYIQGPGNEVYARQMNIGEFAHFMSAAVGRSLEAMAMGGFNTGWKQEWFAKARTAFPALNSMYDYP